jgi:hypothetical protein
MIGYKLIAHEIPDLVMKLNKISGAVVNYWLGLNGRLTEGFIAVVIFGDKIEMKFHNDVKT